MVERKKTRIPPGYTRRRPVLDQRKKDLMLATLVQNQQAFSAMRGTLLPEHFGDYDKHYALLWQTAVKYHDEHGQLPDYHMMLAEIESALDAHPGLLQGPAHEALTELVEFAYDPETYKEPIADNKAYADWAVKTVKHFMEEWLANQMRASAAESSTVAVDMPELLERFSRDAAKIASLQAADVQLSFPEQWDSKISVPLFSTGLPFMDTYLGGGHARGEVIGLLGPFGSCKTTAGFMLGVCGAQHFDRTAKDPAVRATPTLVFMVSYEARLAEMRQRALGYGAQILRSTLEGMDSLENLSTTGDLKEYEKALFRQRILNGDEVEGERERAVQATEVFNRHLVFLDMTGHERRGAGGGGVREIGRVIHAELRRRQQTTGVEHRCGLVVIDYVGAMVARQIAAEEMNNEPSTLRLMVKAAPLQAKSEIADEFDCPVWLIHQLSGEANSFSPAVLPDYTNSADCKSFAENLDFCFTTGRIDAAENVSRLGCGKHRRQAQLASTYIKIEGDMYRVRDVNNLYTLDTNSRKIMRKIEQQRLPGAADAPAASPPPGATATNLF